MIKLFHHQINKTSKRIVNEVYVKHGAVSFSESWSLFLGLKRTKMIQQ